MLLFCDHYAYKYMLVCLLHFILHLFLFFRSRTQTMIWLSYMSPRLYDGTILPSTFHTQAIPSNWSGDHMPDAQELYHLHV